MNKDGIIKPSVIIMANQKQLEEFAMARPRKKKFSDEKLAELGSRFMQIRKIRGLSQIEMAKKIGITQANISQFERGERWPHIKHIVKMARLLKVSSDELLGLAKIKANDNPLGSRNVLRRIQKIEELPRRDKQALLRVIDKALSV